MDNGVKKMKNTIKKSCKSCLAFKIFKHTHKKIIHLTLFIDTFQYNTFRCRAFLSFSSIPWLSLFLLLYYSFTHFLLFKHFNSITLSFPLALSCHDPKHVRTFMCVCGLMYIYLKDDLALWYFTT